MELLILILVLVVVAFGLHYLPGDAQIKNVIRGIVILLAILFVVLFLLDAFGVYDNPVKLR